MWFVALLAIGTVAIVATHAPTKKVWGDFFSVIVLNPHGILQARSDFNDEPSAESWVAQNFGNAVIAIGSTYTVYDRSGNIIAKGNR